MDIKEYADAVQPGILNALLYEASEFIETQSFSILPRREATIVLPSTTANSSKLAEKVLESTINIPPLIYQNQGGLVGVYVARDVDFTSVYELKPVPR